MEALSGEGSRIETGGLSSFLDDSEGISATIARRASAAAGAFLVTEVPHAPYGPSRGLPITAHQRLRPKLRSPSRSKDGCCPSLSGLRTSPGAVSLSVPLEHGRSTRSGETDVNLSLIIISDGGPSLPGETLLNLRPHRPGPLLFEKYQGHGITPQWLEQSCWRALDGRVAMAGC